MSKLITFKLQKAFNNSNVFAYNKNRSKMGEFPCSEELEALFGEKMKIYVKALFRKDGKIEIKELTKATW